MIPVPKDAIDEIGRLTAEVARLRERVAALEEALDMLAIATRKYRSLPRIDGDTVCRLEAELREALEKARALRGDAPKEERCHVWGRDVSRWKLPEFHRRGTPETPARGDGVKEGDD